MPILKNTRDTYGLVSQSLHWVTAALILVLIPLGVYMHELPASTADEASHKFWLYSLHKTLGLTLLIVALARIAWALTQHHPRPLHADRKLEALAAQTVHWTLYGCIVLMPVTGWLHHSALEGFAPIWWPFFQDLPLVPKDPQLADAFALAHFLTGILLALSIFLHVAGALKHVVIDRDGTLSRMLPFSRKSEQTGLQDSDHRFLPPVLAGVALLFVIGASTLIDRAPQPSVPEATVNSNTSNSQWQVNHETSTLAVEILQSGKPISGQFNSWTANIRFDLDALGDARADVEIHTASLALGGVTNQAISADFLNAENFPTASFMADEFVQTGSQSYEARGQLTMLGISKSLTLSFNLVIKDNRAVMSGEATIKRLDFGIGAKGYPAGGLVGLDVKIIVNLEAERNAAPSG